ncbi:hypothetical protein ACTWQF_14890 [Streptomyces sp. 8N114]|uniref:hypothetical protein n=1 Tax=Streptomyces sp. 8N114 TaxID=3457419 RepID=UPI003FD50F8F
MAAPRFVPLSAEQGRHAVDALSQLLVDWSVKRSAAGDQDQTTDGRDPSADQAPDRQISRSDE